MSTVLIVDDNKDDIELTEIALDAARAEVKVKVAVSGEAALKYLREGEELPALILLDLKMCGMSGIETLQEIRADARINKIPVVVVTSSSLESDEKEAYSAGANGYLHKALDLKQFSKDLTSLLDCWVPN
jgi:two-component system, response regulator